MTFTRWSAAIAITAFGGCASNANAQCPSYNFIEVWVDPFDGSDAPNPSRTPNDPNFPFLTIDEAIAYADATRMGGEGLVHCLPGLYSQDSNGEALPISQGMRAPRRPGRPSSQRPLAPRQRTRP